MRNFIFILTIVWGVLIAFSNPSYGETLEIHQSGDTVEVYDYIEITIRMNDVNVVNPFTEITVTGEFVHDNQHMTHVDGFCDSVDGSVFRIRYMPTNHGTYTYKIVVEYPSGRRTFEGSFQATSSNRKGLLCVDKERPNHFVWEGTGEHYFWNGTTTYYLMGWEDFSDIEQIIDRLHGYQINRLRVLIYGRNKDKPWGQPVKSTEDFKLYLNPWPASQPHNIEEPQFDLSRFNIEYWRKYERLLRYAREKDVIVSVIFFIGGQIYPTPFKAYSEDEIRFYRYGVSRFAAFSNVTWDLGNEHNFHREVPKWCDWLGPKVKEWDPYDHILSAHNIVYRTPGINWNDIQLIQRWDAGQNAYMLGEKEKQVTSGRMIPNVNEEYGYEDLWEKYPGHRKAETRRKLAWEISMAGCYQTTGETAERGVGFPPDSGGGWVNGRGDNSMTMLKGYEYMVDFFTSLDWWNYEPANEAVNGSAMCLSKQQNSIIVYMAKSQPVTIRLKNGVYRARWYNPRNGKWTENLYADGPVWTAPEPPDEEDWALLLEYDETLRDVTPPRISHVHINGHGDKLYVVFSEMVKEDSAIDVDNYRIDKNIKIRDITLDGESTKTAVLHIDEPTEEGTYHLTVENIHDMAPNPNRMRETSKIPFQYRDVTRPLIELRFNEGKGTSTLNTGLTRVQTKEAALSKPVPRWTDNTAPNTDGFALDFGSVPEANSINLGDEPLTELKGLRSFTITGWLNVRDNKTGPGGNRIFCTINNGGDGIDLVYLNNGALQLGVNQWPDSSPAKSTIGTISFDENAGIENWRFFAVTYDATALRENVKFYFGNKNQPAQLDNAITYNRGAIGFDAGPAAIGHFNPHTRANAKDRMFRGVLDDIRVFGCKADHSGALPLEIIQDIQNGSNP